MNTPLHDFLTRYAQSGTARLHMPGHKGTCGPLDITEIAGADELYRSNGILRQSEENAARLFGTARTVYSAEGASLCIRAMLYLALLWAGENGRPRRVLAGRNAHRTFMYAAAALDFSVDWLNDGRDLLGCAPTPERLEAALDALSELPAAVYVTSPDYPGRLCDIAGLSAVCRRRGILLLVDNAHGAYLRFLPGIRHPMELGADLCCDSGHKTLPVLTGGAYLHISRTAPAMLPPLAEDAMALFGSTSPSYLIMDSLDRANAALDGDYPERLLRLTRRLERMKASLPRLRFLAEEPMKLTIDANRAGYTGYELADLLRGQGIECEFADRQLLVLMPSPCNTDEELDRVQRVLAGIPEKAPLKDDPPRLPRSERVMRIREAMLSPRERIPASQAAGRVLADACAGCPPAVPILIAGERITEEAVACFGYWGIDTLTVVK